MELIFCIIILVIAFSYGSIVEKLHYKDIKKREVALIKSHYLNFGCKNWSTKKKVKEAYLVCGEAVISVDYFKNFISNLKQIFGGKLTSVETVMDRARREALLRMREKAAKEGVNLILNVKYETSMLNDVHEKKGNVVCAVVAYGTAIKYE